MRLESERFERASLNQESIVIEMGDISDLVKMHYDAFKTVPNICDDEMVDLQDVMVYNKSVFDMCNEILNDLHRLKHFGKVGNDIFSKKSSFGNRLIAESIPLTSLDIQKYVFQKIKKLQLLKREVANKKRPLDNIADASRTAEEFERQYNYLLAQSVEESTDILMARLLLDTADYFRELYT